MIFNGTVCSGTGDAARFLQNIGYVGQFKQKLGFTPFPGTLNVVVPAEQVAQVSELRKGQGILIESFEQNGRRFFSVTAYRASLNGEPVIILFPQASRYGPEMLELISSQNLRKKFSLKDGNEVEISVD